ncbi:hypothetical protein BU26DRAFT_561796 [Trematosphaeria pertusa]|uniref:Uncharacterized protein n=1 Tax=Trematosphaeria pertusa TaxID=390896 RepID=A0A6A6INQ5_9PLEO|nr:uncharacterized protein BU26DRAFT_561796 [Trematosphaeria pertusa]KAF2252016.1 hypothetical protein BU26DRAFT_561796 [Trematosphaeria pertusa]
MDTISKTLSMLTPNKKQTRKCKLANDSTPTSPSPFKDTTNAAKSSKPLDRESSPMEDFLQRANKVGVRTKEDGWVIVDKEKVQKDMQREQEERDEKEWDFLDDEDEIRAELTIL